MTMQLNADDAPEAQERPDTQKDEVNKAREVKFFGVAALSCAAVLGAVALFDYVVDPLSVYHMPLNNVYGGESREIAPGLARHASFERVIMGTSHTENMRGADAEEILGGATINLSISAGTGYEQRRVLDEALRTHRGQAREVVWGLDYFAFFGAPDRTYEEVEWPTHLYDQGIATPFTYLLSIDTLKLSVKALLSSGPQSNDERLFWADRAADEFGVAAVERALETECMAKRTELRAELAPTADMALSLSRNVAALADAYPEVRFKLFFPPISRAHYAFNAANHPVMNARMLEFMTLVAEIAAMRDNVELYNFAMVEETLEYDRYLDLTHHDGALSKTTLRWLAAGKGRATLKDPGFAAAQMAAWLKETPFEMRFKPCDQLATSQ